MKKFIQSRNFWENSKIHLTIFLFFLALLAINTAANAQCTLNAENSVNVFVDENCEGNLDYTALLTDDGAACSNNANYYIVYLYDENLVEIANGTGSVIIPAGNVGNTLYGVVEYNPTGNKTDYIPLQIFDNIKPTIGCYEKSTGFDGELTGGDPTYTRSSSNHPSNSTQCSTNGTAGVYYNVFEFTIDQADNYTFSLTNTNANNMQFFVALYEGDFDPNNVCENFLYDDYENSANAGVNIPINLSLVHGKYFLVTTTVGAGAVGTYSWAFTSTNGGNIYAKKDVCDFNLYCYEKIDSNVFVFGNDNCNNPTEIIVTNEVVTENDCNGNLPDTVFRKIERTYVAKDASNNLSDPLTVNIYIDRMPNSVFYTSIHFPEDLLVTTQNPISCDATYPLDVDGQPSPDYTGWPYLLIGNDTTYIKPGSDFGCGMTVTYNDYIPTPTQCRKQIVRGWEIHEVLCDYPPRILGNIQTIEIADTTAPVVTCPPSETVNTNQFNCFDTYTFPVPTVTDNCQSEWDWDILIKNNSNFPQTFIDNAIAGQTNIKDLPVDTNHITYTLTDACGNKSQCTFDVIVEDKVEPVAVCQTFTTVSFTYDGEAQLPAYAVNSGSYDNCSVVSLQIKRMETNDAFADYVTYDCSDIAGQPWMVILEVTDAAGNKGQCMVSVELQDKLPPTITCPDNQTVECDYIYEPDSLTKYFGWPTAHDNCHFVITTDSTTVENACYDNPVKVITRNFTATDDGGRTANCTQTIEFHHTNYFGYDGSFTNDNAMGAIDWPDDVYITDCIDPNTANNSNSQLNPAQSGWPVLSEYSCDQVGYTYSDFLAIDNDNNWDNNEACFKIIRTWTVIDDCHKVNGSFAKWSYDQVIYVTNNVDPVITGVPDTTTVVCTFDSTCTGGFIQLAYTSSDDCTQDEDLRWKYYLDYNNDNAVGVWDFNSAIFSGNTLDASGDYPIGTHKILWQVWDQCGNSVVKEQLFTIQNCKKPTPICIDGLTVDLTQMPSGPAAMISDTMFDGGSYHTCGYDLVLSFSSDTSDHTKTYTCSDLGVQPIQLWVTALLPDGTVTQDFCETSIEVQDNFSLCNNPIPHGIVAGAIVNIDNEPVENVEISLLGSELGIQKTNSEGKYEFPPVEYGKNYTVAPQSGNDYMNGLSTLDLVYIQKHILGIKDLTSPYAMIASDVNNDKKISASDILTLRKLILGVNEGLDQNNAWKYISSDYTFENPKNPIAENYPQNFKISDLENDMNVNFIAVKIGDASGDATVNGNGEVESRNSETLSFVINNNRVQRNHTVEIPVLAKDFKGIQGFQATLAFDSDILSFENIEAGAIDMNLNNIATNRLSKGYLPVSWFNPTAIDIEDDAVLFTLIFESDANTTISDVISVNSDITKKEAYNSSLDKMNVELEFRNMDSDFELMQNRPNPFTNSTEITFNIPESSKYEFNIYDITGKLIYKTKGIAEKGLNSININKSEINTTGILYYTLSAGKYSATKKMVVIK